MSATIVPGLFTGQPRELAPRLSDNEVLHGATVIEETPEVLGEPRLAGALLSVIYALPAPRLLLLWADGALGFASFGPGSQSGAVLLASYATARASLEGFASNMLVRPSAPYGGSDTAQKAIHPAGAFDGSVEPAQLADVPELAALGESLHGQSVRGRLTFNRRKVEAMFASLITELHGVVFVARDRGRIVGTFAGAVLPDRYCDELVGFDYAFFLDRHPLRDDISLTLILAFSLWCKRRNAREVKVDFITGATDPGHVLLFEQAGFSGAGVLFQMEV